MARKRKLAAVLFSLGCLQAGSVWALGLGDITLESFLNEPLKARVDLLNTGSLHEDQIRVRLATTEDFDRMGVDRAYFLTGIKFEVQVDDNGRGSIVISSDDPVLEPYLDFIIETRWPSGRLLREYTVLVDPPAFDSAARSVSASERVEEVEGIPPTSKKKTETATSGTRVGVGQKSTLGPGQMPQRNYSADTAHSPAPGARYMVRRDENLWSIAKAARPEGTSVHQTMLDIQRLNPDAFIDGNINRIKAGYIIYLPASGDISSADLEQALAEVKQQNEDWRAGRASDPYAAAGPSLRISANDAADGEGADAAASPSRNTAPGSAGSNENTAALESLERSELENAELQGRLDALNDQVETLESIVSVKDEQIAALQQALRDANIDAGAGGLAEDGSGNSNDGDSALALGGNARTEDGSAQIESPQPGSAQVAGDEAGEDGGDNAIAAADASGTAQPAPAAKPSTPAAKTPASAGGSNWYDNLLYPGIALLLLLLGLLLWRRRSARDDAEDEQDVFAGVELKNQDLDVDDDPAPAPPPTEVASPEPEPRLNPNEERGYGQRKHDQYASDVDSGDALAEADIYIAYGRYPQAIELLGNAINAEPRNPVFRLKLLELYARTDREAEALSELEALRDIGDAAAIARAEEVLAATDFDRAPADTVAPGFSAAPIVSAAPTVGNPSGALASPISDDAPASFDSAPDFEDDLTAADDSFSDLEIEDDFADLEDELDLSGDFEGHGAAAAEPNDEDDDDDLVFASEGNPVATKLDLARAYIDMGDEPGARQILEEVLMEGSEEQRQEAQGLIDRLD
ncbi:FimV/HubP family polar landmark protein [Parahaliea mediterranea]|uniref:FimV/HubP family polar landmark protein n=1 Tax=Parahaliea mediterranea TaxID=651086 RepID=UPI000E2EA2F5|nr:FimV/HubP family polar landmark protein [Parahaliea mediterranea]